MTSNNILIGAGLIGVGALMIVLGIRKNKRCSGRAVGRITGVHEDQDTDEDGFNHYSYSPEFEYEVNGKNYSQTAPFRTYQKRKYPIGSEMKISYNPRKPEEIRFVEHPFPLPMGVVFLFFGAVLIYCYFI
ncbi:MAG: DUF3592 domain-containing protein [Eubacterium sp.]|nr:DUF3592 domain-containing protein [Eubacterium sp.]